MEEKKEVPADIAPNEPIYGKCMSRLYSPTEAGLMEKIRAYFEKYPAEKYEPYFEVSPNHHKDGYWWCQLRRWHFEE